MEEKIIKNIITRLVRLETTVFKNKLNDNKKQISKDFSGPTGGLRLLVSNGFFNTKQTFGEIRKELAKNNYHYSSQAAQSALSRLSKPGNLLVSLKEGGKKNYVRRK